MIAEDGHLVREGVARLRETDNVPAMRRHLRSLAAAILVAAVLTGPGAASALASAPRDNVGPCRNHEEPAPGARCRGPVDNTSGGGGSALTIAVSVIVGLGIATVAFIVLRRQLASHRPVGGDTPTSRTGEQT